MNRLEGKVAVVTGGNSGIGLAAARLFAAEGASVVIVGRRPEAVQQAIADLGERVSGIVGDVADPATHARISAEVGERFGGLDIYVANAGMAILTPAADVGESEYDDQFQANTKAVFLGVQAIAPLLRDGGSIVLTSSIASGKVLDGHAVYAGSKAAIEAFARSWAIELKDRRIRVNVVSPGPTDTPILEKLGVTDVGRPAFEAALARTILAGRLGRPEEIANAMLFLASDDAAFVNGVNLRVDGGMSLT